MIYNFNTKLLQVKYRCFNCGHTWYGSIRPKETTCPNCNSDNIRLK